MKKPKFIAIEGGEGSGKSTLVKALALELGESVRITREPGGSPYGETIRKVALNDKEAQNAPGETILCLMFAARFDHVRNMIKPTLDRGVSVITDRFDASSYAYNVMAQSQGELDELFWELRKQLLVKPDLYIFVDVDPAEGLRRACSRNEIAKDGNHFDDRDIRFHEQVRNGCLRFMQTVRHVVIDANRPLEDVKADFLTAIREEMEV